MTFWETPGMYTPVEKLPGDDQMGASDDLARQYWRQRECWSPTSTTAVSLKKILVFERESGKLLSSDRDGGLRYTRCLLDYTHSTQKTVLQRYLHVYTSLFSSWNLKMDLSSSNEYTIWHGNLTFRVGVLKGVTMSQAWHMGPNLPSLYTFPRKRYSVFHFNPIHSTERSTV